MDGYITLECGTLKRGRYSLLISHHCRAPWKRLAHALMGWWLHRGGPLEGGRDMIEFASRQCYEPWLEGDRTLGRQVMPGGA